MQRIDIFHWKYLTLAENFVKWSVHGKSSNFVYTANLYEDGFLLNRIQLEIYEFQLLILLVRLLQIKAKNKNTFVSGNASDEKNLHSGGRKFIFLN